MCRATPQLLAALQGDRAPGLAPKSAPWIKRRTLRRVRGLGSVAPHASGERVWRLLCVGPRMSPEHRGGAFPRRAANPTPTQPAPRSQTDTSASAAAGPPPSDTPRSTPAAPHLRRTRDTAPSAPVRPRPRQDPPPSSRSGAEPETARSGSTRRSGSSRSPAGASGSAPRAAHTPPDTKAPILLTTSRSRSPQRLP